MQNAANNRQNIECKTCEIRLAAAAIAVYVNKNLSRHQREKNQGEQAADSATTPLYIQYHAAEQTSVANDGENIPEVVFFYILWIGGRKNDAQHPKRAQRC